MSTKPSSRETTAKISISSHSATSTPNILPPQPQQGHQRLPQNQRSPRPLPAAKTKLPHRQSPNTAAPLPINPLHQAPPPPHPPDLKSTNSASPRPAPSPKPSSQTTPRASSSQTSTSSASYKKSPSAKPTVPSSSYNTNPPPSSVKRSRYPNLPYGSTRSSSSRARSLIADASGARRTCGLLRRFICTVGRS